MPTCVCCGRSSPLIASTLGACADCIRRKPDEVLPHITRLHRETRAEFGLPESPPQSTGGVHCPLCVNACTIGEKEMGYCGLRTVREGKMVHLAGTRQRGVLHWYHDRLPTNCVADWVCPGSRQRGYVNLAVFYGACSFNCLFCQNWYFRSLNPEDDAMSASELADAADARTFCACYFGGDPSPQLPHALATSRLLAERGVTVCWETNGSMNPELLRRAVEISLRTGGCIKFDLKAWSQPLHLALTGATNSRSLENFALAASYISQRPDSPVLVASTLLIPGYIDIEEIKRIASFIASVNLDIPYALLGFHPNFYIHDLPRTSVRHAEEAERVARAAGLRNVRLGNRHLLSRAY